MRRSFVAISLSLLVEAAIGSDASGATSAGGGALALAALVGAHAPALSASERHALADMLDGRLGFAYSTAISVSADSVSCRASDVDISSHACELKFGARTRMLAGRAAHELFATLLENGVPSQGAAGSIVVAVAHLSCTVKPAEVKQKAGGGADCAFAPGP
jgi:hypothetical protein